MKKLLTILVLALALTACGPVRQGSQLSAQQQTAIKAVEANLGHDGYKTVGTEQYIGQVAKDAQGNRATFVWVAVSDGTTPITVEIIVLEDPKGKLIAADVMYPSGIWTVQGQ